MSTLKQQLLSAQKQATDNRGPCLDSYTQTDGQVEALRDVKASFGGRLSPSFLALKQDLHTVTAEADALRCQVALLSAQLASAQRELGALRAQVMLPPTQQIGSLHIFDRVSASRQILGVQHNLKPQCESS